VKVRPTLSDCGSPNRLTASFIDAHLRGFDRFLFDFILRVLDLVKPTAFWLGEFSFRLGYIITLRFELVK